MKGIIFSSFLEYADKVLGEDFVEELIENTNLSTGGAYTTVGQLPSVRAGRYGDLCPGSSCH